MTMISESIHAIGKVQFILTDENGNVKEQFDENLVVNTGLDFLASAVLNASATPFSYMAVGTGSTAEAATDTALVTETARLAFTTSSVTTNVASISTTFAPGTATAALTEAGIFNAAAAGTMLSRVTFPVINKGASDTLTINWTITVS